MTGVIHKLMKDLGGERYKFQSIDDFASAFDEAKEKFITSVQEDADVKASDKVAAAFQVKEDQLTVKEKLMICYMLGIWKVKLVISIRVL